MLFYIREGMTVLVESHYSELASGLNFSFFTIKKNKATTKNPNLKNLFNLYIWKRNGRNLQLLKQKKCIMNLSIARKGFPFSCLNHLINLSNLEIKLVRGNKSAPQHQIPSVGHWDSSLYPARSQNLAWCPWPLHNWTMTDGDGAGNGHLGHVI